VSEKIKRERTFAQVPDALILDKRVTDFAARLWCRLDRYAGQDGRAVKSRAGVAKDLGVSEATVKRGYANLIETGWLVRDRERPGSNVWLNTLLERPRKPKVGSETTRGRVRNDPTPGSRMTRPIEGEVLEGQVLEGGGEAVGSTTSLTDLVEGSTEPPLRCPKHSDVAQPGPCGPCGDARRTHDAWKNAHPGAGRVSTTDIMLAHQALKGTFGPAPFNDLLAIEAGAA
jgi:hypothetical protein